MWWSGEGRSDEPWENTDLLFREGEFDQKAVRATDGIQIITGKARFYISSQSKLFARHDEPLKIKGHVIFLKMFRTQPAVVAAVYNGRRFVQPDQRMAVKAVDVSESGFDLECEFHTRRSHLPLSVSWLAVGHL